MVVRFSVVSYFYFCKAGDPTQGFLHSGDNSTNEVSLAEVQIKKNKT